jgi:hypothetical protein
MRLVLLLEEAEAVQGVVQVPQQVLVVKEGIRVEAEVLVQQLLAHLLQALVETAAMVTSG